MTDYERGMLLAALLTLILKLAFIAAVVVLAIRLNPSWAFMLILVGVL